MVTDRVIQDLIKMSVNNESRVGVDQEARNYTEREQTKRYAARQAGGCVGGVARGWMEH